MHLAWMHTVGTRLVLEWRAGIDAVAEALYERVVLTGEDVTEIVRAVRPWMWKAQGVAV